MRETTPGTVLPAWYVELVLGGDPNGRPVGKVDAIRPDQVYTDAEKSFDKRIEYGRLAQTLLGLRADSPAITPSASPAPLPHCLRNTCHDRADCQPQRRSECCCPTENP